MERIGKWLRQNWQIALAVGGVGAVGWLVTRKSSTPRSDLLPCDVPHERGERGIEMVPSLSRSDAMELIAAEARRQRVPPEWAFSSADQETGIRSGLVADLDWPWRPGNHDLILEEYPTNPYRNCQGIWVTYGLFGLLSRGALKRVDPDAHPSVLLDPQINTRLGVSAVARVFRCSGGDYIVARDMYTGCTKCDGSPVLGRDGRPKCSAGNYANREANSRRIASRWGIAV